MLRFVADGMKCNRSRLRKYSKFYQYKQKVPFGKLGSAKIVYDVYATNRGDETVVSVVAMHKIRAI